MVALGQGSGFSPGVQGGSVGDRDELSPQDHLGRFPEAEAFVASLDSDDMSCC